MLLTRGAAADRHRGLELLSQARDIWQRKQVGLQMMQIVESWAARGGPARRPRRGHSGDAQSRR